MGSWIAVAVVAVVLMQLPALLQLLLLPMKVTQSQKTTNACAILMQQV